MWHVWWRGEVHLGFWWRNLRKYTTWEYLGVDGRIILKWIFEKWDRNMHWIDLAQDRDRWRALVKYGNEP